ncbi:MAG: hypothetical protein V4808_11490 [Pseudomonadota bacterium]
MKKMMMGALAGLLLAAAPAQAQDLAWGQWTYVQGDKAVQYRVAKTGMEGDVALLRYQLRVEPDNSVACYAASCEGYVAYIPVFDPVARDYVGKHHLFFPKGSAGTYDLPETVHFPIRRSETGQRFLDEKTGLPMYELFDNPGVFKVTEVLHGCVDDKMAGSSETRCPDFDFGAMERVGG